MADESQVMTRSFFITGTEILGLNSRSQSLTTLLDVYQHNFKYSPSRCAFLFLRIRGNPFLPDEFEPKHLLWTLYFLLTYSTERRLCCILKADRKTIRKYTWPTISALASLADDYVSGMVVICNVTPINDASFRRSFWKPLKWQNQQSTIS